MARQAMELLDMVQLAMEARMEAHMRVHTLALAEGECITNLCLGESHPAKAG